MSQPVPVPAVDMATVISGEYVLVLFRTKLNQPQFEVVQTKLRELFGEQIVVEFAHTDNTQVHDTIRVTGPSLDPQRVKEYLNQNPRFAAS